MRVGVVVGLAVASVFGVVTPAGAASAWRVVPTAAGMAYGNVSSVRCPSDTVCFAVGNRDNPHSQSTMAQRWNGTKWVALNTPIPAGAVSSQLTSVVCPTTSNCLAVGQYNTIAPTTKTLVMRWNGKAWTIFPSPNVPSSPVNLLNSIACTSATSCFAVGSSFVSTPDSSAQQTLIEQWNGSTWSIVPSPNQLLARDSVLSGVACQNATSCFAVGNYTNQLVTSTLTEHWDGMSWTIVPSPNPPSSTSNELVGVTCSAINCVAVGKGHGTLVEVWNGTIWGIVTSQNPAGSTGSSLTGVSCPVVSQCFAVGIQIKATKVHRLVEVIPPTGGATIVNVPIPAGETQSNLAGVTCRSVSSCFAVGNYRTGTSRRPLFERYS